MRGFSNICTTCSGSSFASDQCKAMQSEAKIYAPHRSPMPRPTLKQDNTNVSEEFRKYFKTQKYLYENSSSVGGYESSKRDEARAGTTSMWSEKFFASPDKRKICRQLVVLLLLFSPFTVCESTARASKFSQFSDIVLNRLGGEKKHNSQPDVRKAV